MNKDPLEFRTRQSSPTTEKFRVLLRQRLMQMNEAAARNGASPEYLEHLRINTEKILQATQQEQGNI